MRRTTKFGDSKELGNITVKRHKLSVRFEGEGFAVTLEDGQVVAATSLAALKLALHNRLEAVKKEARPNVACLYDGSGSNGCVLVPAVYVGEHKTNRWSPHMFDVDISGLTKKQKDGLSHSVRYNKRQNLSGSEVKDDIYSPHTPLKELAALKEEVAAAQKKLEAFMKEWHFNPLKQVKK